MLIIGCDVPTRFQQIAMLDSATGEILERRLEHPEPARDFYAALAGPTRVGMEATGHAQWFERMLREGGHELWVGDAAEIRARVVRKQKTDSRDALPILGLLRTDRFPRIWIPSVAERDARQLLRHRGKLVRFRTSVENQLHAWAMGEGVCRRKKWGTLSGRRELEGLALGPWASRRRRKWIEMLDRLNPWIGELDQVVKREAENRPEAVRWRQQSGVGPVTVLALVLPMGPGDRFRRSKPVGSYLGLNPRESSSGGRQRLGSIRKQGNSMMRYGLNEGLAQLESGESSSRSGPALARLFAESRQISLSQLERGFLQFDSPKVALAYAESLAAVEMLRDRYGAYQLPQLLKTLGQGRMPAEALKEVLRMSYDELETELAQSLATRYGR